MSTIATTDRPRSRFLFRPPKCGGIGIDVGAHSVKVAAVERDARGWRVRFADRLRVGPEGEPEPPFRQVLDNLGPLLAEWRERTPSLPTRRCACVFSGNELDLREFDPGGADAGTIEERATASFGPSLATLAWDAWTEDVPGGGADLTVPVTVTLNGVQIEDAFDSILTVHGCAWTKQRGIIYVSKIDADSKLGSDLQGRDVRVIPLNFVSANDVEKVAKGLVSPAGKVFIAEADSKDQRRTRHHIVVEDFPQNLDRIERYVAQIDVAPRQVMIEAHIFQVGLQDETRHGVNFDYLSKLANAELRVKSVGFANPAAGPAMLFSVNGNDLGSLIEALKATTDAKTLASPKVLVLNGQEAKIQIGERLGFFVTTTTTTGTLQSVQFLDVGVVLNVTPNISDDNRVMMRVKPEVSRGQINPVTGLPQEETTEVETTVILPNGNGIILGGLIQDADSDQQTKLPFLGDAWLVGRLFQRRVTARKRTEIIVALVPRIVPFDPEFSAREAADFQRGTTRLVDQSLRQVDRPYDGQLPDAERDPRRVKFRRFADFPRNLRDTHPLPKRYYWPAASDTATYTPGVPFNDRVPPVDPITGTIHDSPGDTTSTDRPYDQ